MTPPFKHHRLTFRLEMLESVRSGEKRCTVRLSSRAAAIRSGDRLVLAFGNRMRPVIVEATAARVEHIDVSVELETLHQAEAELEAETLTPEAEAELEAATVAYEAMTPAERRAELVACGASEIILDALEASGGGDYDAVLDEAEARGVSIVTCVWFKLDSRLVVAA